MHDEGLHDLAARRGVCDRLHVVDGHTTVGDVFGLLEDGDAYLAKIEAARRACTHDVLRDAALRQRLLQPHDELFGAFFGTRALRVPIGSTVRAHEEVSIPERHLGGWTLARACGLVKLKVLHSSRRAAILLPPK
jgi:hypothetical protein